MYGIYNSTTKDHLLKSFIGTMVTTQEMEQIASLYSVIGHWLQNLLSGQ